MIFVPNPPNSASLDLFFSPSVERKQFGWTEGNKSTTVKPLSQPNNTPLLTRSTQTELPTHTFLFGSASVYLVLGVQMGGLEFQVFHSLIHSFISYTALLPHYQQLVPRKNALVLPSTWH